MTAQARRTTWDAVVLAGGLMMTAVLVIGCGQPPRDDFDRQARAELAFQEGANRPPNAKTLYVMAQLLVGQGKQAEASFVLNRLIVEHPDFVPAYVELAEMYMRQRRIDDAMRVLSAGLGRLPDDPVLNNNMGMCEMFKRNHEAALGRFTRAAAVAPGDARFRANMAAVLGLMGRYDESLALYRQVVPPGEAHYNLAVLCEARQDHVRAEQEHDLAREAGFKPRPQDPSESCRQP